MAAGRRVGNQIKVASPLSRDHSFSAEESAIALSVEGRRDRDIRVTILPTTRGEAAHLRLLAAPEEVLEPGELGLSEANLSGIKEALRSPQGLILITGATGAGKTMTLYSLASLLDFRGLIAVSVEDPVEYDLPYVRQVQADPVHGLSMQAALKSLLRMDPDIVLVGEIRDASSAVTAVRAAAAGRFVLATMHARDVPLAVAECRHFSVPSHLLAATLRVAVSQTLVRRVCAQCREERNPTRAEAEVFDREGIDLPNAVSEAVGCEFCHGYGYAGRTGVFEVVRFDRTLREAVSQGLEAERLRDAFRDRGHATLRAAALEKAAAGETTMEEVKNLRYPLPDGNGERGEDAEP